MKSNTLKIRIIQVENGYVIIEDHPGHEMFSGRKWVADSPESLAHLVESLADAARKDSK